MATDASYSQLQPFRRMRDVSVHKQNGLVCLNHDIYIKFIYICRVFTLSFILNKPKKVKKQRKSKVL